MPGLVVLVAIALNVATSRSTVATAQNREPVITAGAWAMRLEDAASAVTK
jgi:hypothetical protein